MLVGEDVLPAERRVDADVEGLGEGDQLAARVACSFAGYHHRAPRLAQPAGDVPHLLGSGRGEGLAGHALLRGNGSILAADILWEGEHDRARTAGGGDAQPPLHEL